MKQKKRKILLIEPPFYRLYKNTFSLVKLPLSLAYLAGAIMTKKPDWEVKIYNSDFSPQDEPMDYKYLVGPGFNNYLASLGKRNSPVWDEIKGIIESYGPSVVGITAKSQNFASACIVAEYAKSFDEETVVVVGGPHASIVRTDVLRHPMIDIGVFGEGEETIVDILNSVEGGLSLSSVKGVVYRDGNDVVENPHRELIEDLNSLPFPVTIAPVVLLDYKKYPLQAFKNIFAIRGCPNNCSFCGSRNIWSRRVRFRSTENIISEIQAMRRIGLDYVHFDDDTFGVKKVFIEELCNAIKRHCPGLKWSCEMHVKLVDNETIGLMRSAGCRSIQIGVESGNNEMLKLIRKRITIEEALLAARIIKKHKIYLQTFFIVGFPEENEKSLKDTISAMISFPADLVIHNVFTPYIGTELFDYCKKQGTIPKDFDPSLYNHQSPANYFCRNIEKDVFKARIRELEKKVDQINSRRRIRMYLSYEGYLRIKEKGLAHSITRFFHFCRNAIPTVS